MKLFNNRKFFTFTWQIFKFSSIVALGFFWVKDNKRKLDKYRELGQKPRVRTFLGIEFGLEEPESESKTLSPPSPQN